MQKMTLDQALELLKNAVKESHLDNQPHIDLTLVSASDRFEYQKALMVMKEAIAQEQITEVEVKERLGL